MIGRQAAAGLAAALGLVSLSVLALASAPPSVLERRWPACPARASGRRCALCGMSHSFRAAAQGRFTESARWNRFGPWLYAGFVLQTAAGAAGAALLTRPAHKERRRRAGRGADDDGPVSAARQKGGQQPDQAAYARAHYHEGNPLSHVEELPSTE